MQSLNFEGQILIENAWAARIINREKSIDLIEQSINYFLLEQIEKSKEKIIAVRELIFQSMYNAFIAVKGLKPLVLNEKSDALYHNELNKIHDKLYEIYSKLFTLDSNTEQADNVISYREFQLCRIIKNLSAIRDKLKNII